MICEMGRQWLMMGLQLGAGMMKLQAFEGLNAPCLILLQVAAHGVFTHSDAGGDLVVRQAFGFQQQRFHLHLHARVRMVIALIMQFLDVFFGKSQAQHAPTSCLLAGFSSLLPILPEKPHFVPVASIVCGPLSRRASETYRCSRVKAVPRPL